MENPKKLTLISIRPEHAGEGIEYGHVHGCAFFRAIKDAGLNVLNVGDDSVRLDDYIQGRIRLDFPFTALDFRAVRAGKIIEYLYDEANKVMTRIEEK